MDNWKKFPPCFSCRADYELWLNNRYQWNLAAHHCTDCLPSYKMRMAKAGRCEHPETTFRFRAEEGFEADDVGVHIYGHWGHEPQPQIVRVIRKRKETYVPSSARAKRIAMGIDPKPVGIVAKEERDRKYFEEQERKMRERMNFGR